MAKNQNATLCAVLSYLLIGIIWYFVDDQMRKDSYVRFHVRQSVALLILWIIFAIIGSVLNFIPVIGWIISALLGLVVLVLWLMGLIGALQGKTNEVPIIGGFAKSFSF